MSVMTWIVYRLNDASDFFYDLYLEAYSSWYIPNAMGDLFYELCLIFNRLAGHFSDFFSWLLTKAQEIDKILSWSTIRSYIRDWLPWLEDTVDWFLERWYWFQGEVGDWWSATRATVQGWIAIATEGLDTLKVAWDSFWRVTFPQWTARLDSLWVRVDYFFTVQLPTLFDIKTAWEWWGGRLTETKELIDTAFREAEPFWAGWQEVKNSVVEFISNPLDWIKLHVIEPIVDDFNRGFDRGISGEE